MPHPARFIAPLTALLATLAAATPGSATAQAATPPAQPPSIEVRGKITDTANAPIPKAAVSVRLKATGVTIAGALAGPDGSFRIPDLRPGAFSIRVAYIGYSPVIQDLTIRPGSPVLDLGVAKLAPIAVSLDAVTTRETRDAIVTEPDKTTYRAREISAGAVNASEILENVPSVQVDIDGKVSLRGNENVVVQINGRPTPLRGAQLAAYLKTLPASTIDRIEVIPNPSAKYDPEGMAGIINVALLSNVDLGLSGSGMAAVSDRDRNTTSGNVGYQMGKLSTLVTGGFNADHRTAVGINDRERYDDANVLQSVTSQDINLRPENRGLNVNATVDYRLSARDVLSNALMVNRRWSGETSVNTHAILDGSGNTLAQSLRPRDLDAKGSMLDYDVALRRTITPRMHEISSEFRFTRAHDEDTNDERWAAGNSYTNGKIERNDAISRTLTGQVDYLKAFRPRTKLETGWKSTMRWIDRDYAVTVDPTGTGTWMTSPLSNALAFDEGVHAVYGVFSQGVKKWDLQAGLRGEYADRTFSLATREYPYDYMSLFPSAIALYTVDPTLQTRVSYSRRIRRPGTQELNPFPNYFDADNVMFGNPELSPEYTNAYELGLTKTGPKGMLQLTPFYRHTTNVIRMDINTADTLDGREVTSISQRNLAESNSWGADLTGQFRPSPRITALTNFSLFKLVTDGGSLSALSSDAIGWMGRLNLTAQATSMLTVQAMYNYRAAMKMEQGEQGAQQMMMVMLRHKVQGDRGAVMLRVVDPFEMMRFRIKAGDGKVSQLTMRNPASRAVFLGYQYNFGRPPRVREVAPDATSGGSVGFGGPPGGA